MHLIIDMNLKLYYLFWVRFGVITILKFHVKSLNIYKICIGYVGTGSVLPLNAMVEAAPWVHGSCVWASYLPSTATCVINQSKSMVNALSRSGKQMIFNLRTTILPLPFH